MRSSQVIKPNSTENSLMSSDRHNIDTRSSFKNAKVEIPRSFITNGSHLKQTNIDSRNELLNAIKYTQSISKIEINPKFIDLLVNEFSMTKIVIVSIWGSQQSGKSFLIDSLLSISEQTIMRVFSKSENQGANCSMRRVLTKEGNPILFLDWKGFQRAERQAQQSDVFMLMYLISSVIIFNCNCSDLKYQNIFLEKSQTLKNKLVSNEVQYSLPQLQVIRRDVNPSNNRTTNFLQSIQNTELFQPNPGMVYLQYPGTQSIKANQILDAPIVTLDKSFIRSCTQLLDILKGAKPRYINDNPINSNMLAILLGSFVNMMNRHHRVVVDNCWEDVLEALAVNAYNSFVTAYTQSLEREFKDQNPLNRYHLFKKLSKAKTEANIKLQNFTNIKGQPIFDKYKDKLKDFTKGKEQIIISINTSKANTLNNRFVSQTKKKHIPSNQPIKQQKIYNYLNSFKTLPLEQNNQEIISFNIKQMINNQLKKVGNKSQMPQLKTALKNFQERDRQIQSQIDQKNQNINELDNHLKQQRGTLQRYKIKIQQKQEDFNKLKSQNIRRDEQRKSKMTEQQKQAQSKLNQLKKQKSTIIEKQQQTIENLQLQLKHINQKVSTEEVEMMSRIKEKDQAIKGMNKKLKQLQKAAQERRSQIQRMKSILAKPEKKKKTFGCCG